MKVNEYKVGQKVKWVINEPDGKSIEYGIIKEVHDDYMLVDIPTVSDHVYFDLDDDDLNERLMVIE